MHFGKKLQTSATVWTHYEVKGQGGTKRRCLREQEVKSCVGQAVTVGTFRPMEWDAVVGLITHWAVNTVHRYCGCTSEAPCRIEANNGAHCVTKFMVKWRNKQMQIILQSGCSDAQNAHQHAAISNTLIQESQEDDENIWQKFNKKHRAMKTTARRVITTQTPNSNYPKST